MRLLNQASLRRLHTQFAPFSLYNGKLIVPEIV